MRRSKKTNKAMRYLLENVPPSIHVALERASPNFTEWDHCILIDTTELGTLKTVKETIYLDRTELEASINHVHLSDFASGMKIMDQWTRKLQEDYSGKQFIIILSCQPDGGDVVVRFYQYRKDDPEWVALDNLEGYKEEAILVIGLMNNAVL
ncbi:hypothetical protein MKZ24_01830 [Paenibacillus sp. FSL R7-0297]|nr:hypothetical protein [Paenibacillus sp. FSL R5-0912]